MALNDSEAYDQAGKMLGSPEHVQTGAGLRTSNADTLFVRLQIDQMVRFIKQEAQEKANEIGVSAEEVSSRSADRHKTALLLPGRPQTWEH